MSATLLESIEGLELSPFVAEPAEVWERLQAEKDEVSRKLLAAGEPDRSVLNNFSATTWCPASSWLP